MDESKRLIDQFHADKSIDRWQAVHALGKLGTAAIEPLLAVLQGSDQEAKPWAAAALGEIGDSCTVELLITALQTTDGTLCLFAFLALGQIRDPRAVGPLIDVMRIMNPGWINVRSAAANSLGQIGKPSVEPLLAILQGDADFDSQQFAIAELGGIGDLRAVEPLIAALVHPNVWRRWGAIVALSKI